MITAEGLNDPAGWSRFHPSSQDSQRSLFERAVREEKLRPLPGILKSLLKPGVSVFFGTRNGHRRAIRVELTVGGNPFRTYNAA